MTICPGSAKTGAGTRSVTGDCDSGTSVLPVVAMAGPGVNAVGGGLGAMGAAGCTTTGVDTNSGVFNGVAGAGTAGAAAGVGNGVAATAVAFTMAGVGAGVEVGAVCRAAPVVPVVAGLEAAPPVVVLTVVTSTGEPSVVRAGALALLVGAGPGANGDEPAWGWLAFGAVDCGADAGKRSRLACAATGRPKALAGRLPAVAGGQGRPAAV